MSFVATWKRRREKKYRILYKRGPSTLALVFAGMALALWGLLALLSSYPAGLYLYYTVVPKTTALLSSAIQKSSQEMVARAESEMVVVPTEPVVAEVQKDTTLPEGHYLRIPQIGIDTPLLEASNSDYESALRKGVWRVGEFGDPTVRGKPMILAAHRFGYIEWSQDYRIQNSFYELPKLKNGDMVEIVWNQHRYTYQVQRVEEGTQIRDYASDLILYTCKFLVSPVRIFVYGKLIS